MTVWRASLAGLLLLLVTPLAQAASAQRLDNFYQGSAPVSSRSDAQRQSAINSALGEVLVRMTGDVSISLSDAAQPLLGSASRYVRSYRYADQPLPEDAPPGTPAGQQLLVDFDGRALARAARDYGLPLWDELRPVTLVWVLGPVDGRPRQIWSAEQIEAQLPGLREAAFKRGLPLRYPVLDEQDLGALGVYDLVSLDRPRIQAASARYQPSHVLLLRLESRGMNWSARWAFPQEDGPVRQWESMGATPDEAVRGGMSPYADELAQRYALRVAAGWVQSARLRVQGLRRLDDYARVSQYLEALNLVEWAQPSEVRDDSVVFQLQFEGELADLKRTLDAGQVLVEAPATLGGGFMPAEETVPAGGADETPAKDSGLQFFGVVRQTELNYRLR